MAAVPFIFDGSLIETMGDTMSAALKAMDEGRAAEFKEAYIQNCIDCNGGTREEAERIVDSNLGYMSGYYDAERMTQIQKAYGAAHPVFGSVIPTPEEAFEAGKRMADPFDPLSRFDAWLLDNAVHKDDRPDMFGHWCAMHELDIELGDYDAEPARYDRDLGPDPAWPMAGVD